MSRNLETRKYKTNKKKTVLGPEDHTVEENRKLHNITAYTTLTFLS